MVLDSPFPARWRGWSSASVDDVPLDVPVFFEVIVGASREGRGALDGQSLPSVFDERWRCDPVLPVHLPDAVATAVPDVFAESDEVSYVFLYSESVSN